MIKQLFRQNVLITAAMAVLLMLFASGFNIVQAQSSSALASSGLSESEIQEFKTDLLALIDDAETNPTYGQVERAIRLDLYDNVRKNVVNGYSIERAVDASVHSTMEFANEEYPTHTVDIRQLGEETKNQLL